MKGSNLVLLRTEAKALVESTVRVLPFSYALIPKTMALVAKLSPGVSDLLAAATLRAHHSHVQGILAFIASYEEVKNQQASEILSDQKTIQRRPELAQEGRLYAEATGAIKLELGDLKWALATLGEESLDLKNVSKEELLATHERIGLDLKKEPKFAVQGIQNCSIDGNKGIIMGEKILSQKVTSEERFQFGKGYFDACVHNGGRPRGMT